MRVRAKPWPRLVLRVLQHGSQRLGGLLQLLRREGGLRFRFRLKPEGGGMGRDETPDWGRGRRSKPRGLFDYVRLCPTGGGAGAHSGAACGRLPTCSTMFDYVRLAAHSGAACGRLPTRSTMFDYVGCSTMFEYIRLATHSGALAFRRTVPHDLTNDLAHGAARCRTVPYDVARFRTIPYGAARFRTIPYDAARCQQAPRSPGRPHAACASTPSP